MKALAMGDAVALAAAKCQRTSSGLGVRALLIKGSPLEQYGLREHHVSSDVDVLVEASGVQRYSTALTASGWRRREASFISRRSTFHSEAYLHDEWPCDVDVHWRFPGFLKAPDEVFEVLWRRREVVTIAHQPITVPDRLSSILILALHSLRGTEIQARHADELEFLVSVDLTRRERLELGRLALATGCAATLETVLPRMDVHVRPPAEELASAELREWRGRIASGSRGAYFWLLALRRAPLREKPVILWRAVWPTDHDLLITRPEVRNTPRQKLLGRIARFGRGLRSFPSAVRAFRVARKNRPLVQWNERR